MNICPIFNLNSILSTLDEPPKLALDVVLADFNSTDLADHSRIEDFLFFYTLVGRRRRVTLKP